VSTLLTYAILLVYCVGAAVTVMAISVQPWTRRSDWRDIPTVLFWFIPWGYVLLEDQLIRASFRARRRKLANAHSDGVDQQP